MDQPASLPSRKIQQSLMPFSSPTCLIWSIVRYQLDNFSTIRKESCFTHVHNTPPGFPVVLRTSSLKSGLVPILTRENIKIDPMPVYS